jgi:hypothetical protein
MASLFGGRRRRSPEDDGEDDRSGNGKAQRRRLSPEEDAATPAEAGAAAAAATGSSPGWLSGFVSGARRVFSSVLLFSSPEETGSGQEEDEEGNGLNSGEQFLLRLVLSLSHYLATSLHGSVSASRLFV